MHSLPSDHKVSQASTSQAATAGDHFLLVPPIVGPMRYDATSCLCGADQRPCKISPMVRLLHVLLWKRDQTMLLCSSDTSHVPMISWGGINATTTGTTVEAIATMFAKICLRAM